MSEPTKSNTVICHDLAEFERERTAQGDEGTPEMRAGAGVAAAELRVTLAALDQEEQPA